MNDKPVRVTLISSYYMLVVIYEKQLSGKV